MTADMASDCSKVEQSENGNLIVTLADKVNKDFCSLNKVSKSNFWQPKRTHSAKRSNRS